MIETITQRDLPDLFAATYEAKGVWNEAIHRFSDSPTGGTHWELETEFRFSGIMWLIAKVMPKMFRKETMASMQRFKAFAESAKTESR